MSDTQAKDRLAQLQADLSVIISKRADCLRIQEAAVLAEAIADLSRLSRVEQALGEARELSARLTNLMGRTACYGPSDALREVVNRIALVLSAAAALRAEPGGKP